MKKILYAAAAMTMISVLVSPLGIYASELPAPDTTTISASDDTASTPATSFDAQTETETESSETQNPPTYTLQSLNLAANGQGTLELSPQTLTSLSRFEILYNSTGEAPVINFKLNGDNNLYQAAYGQTQPEGSPIVAVKQGQDVEVATASGKQMTMSMYAVYFDPSKYSGLTSVEGEITRGADDTTVIFAQTEVPDDWDTIVDGEETKQQVLADTVVMWYSASSSPVGQNDVATTVQADTTQNAGSAQAQKPKQLTTEQKIMNLLKMIGPVFIVIAFFIGFSIYKKDQARKEAAREKEKKRKEKRKKKEQRIRENDHLEEALNEYADDYTDDEYYEGNINDTPEGEETGFSQIEQEHFTDYNTGIKEALHTVPPEAEAEYARRKEEILKQREESMRKKKEAEQNADTHPSDMFSNIGAHQYDMPDAASMTDPAITTPVMTMAADQAQAVPHPADQPPLQPVKDTQTETDTDSHVHPSLPAFDTSQDNTPLQKRNDAVSQKPTLPSFGSAMPDFGNKKSKPAAGMLM